LITIIFQFAVLLSGDDLNGNSNCDEFGWVQIASLSVLGASIVVSMTVIGLFYTSSSFRALVKGFDPHLKVSALIAKANVPTDIHTAH